MLQKNDEQGRITGITLTQQLQNDM